MPQNSPFAALFNGPPGDWQRLWKRTGRGEFAAYLMELVLIF
jgi:hypothetical protein